MGKLSLNNKKLLSFIAMIFLIITGFALLFTDKPDCNIVFVIGYKVLGLVLLSYGFSMTRFEYWEEMDK